MYRTGGLDSDIGRLVRPPQQETDATENQDGGNGDRHGSVGSLEFHNTAIEVSHNLFVVTSTRQLQTRCRSSDRTNEGETFPQRGNLPLVV
jgi:hypothetical protein